MKCYRIIYTLVYTVLKDKTLHLSFVNASHSLSLLGLRITLYCTSEACLLKRQRDCLKVQRVFN